MRAYVNNYIGNAVRDYEKRQKRYNKKINEKSITKIEKGAFVEVATQYPDIYDYYIKMKEEQKEDICNRSKKEFDEQESRLIDASKNLISLFNDLGYVPKEKISAREEAKERIKFFKHIIEDCDGYKNLYYEGKQIAKENDLQRLFKFVWYGSDYKLDAETNNGRGYSDFIVSKGQKNQNIIEFKLASNTNLPHVFTQIKIYEAANCCDGSLVVIFCFTEGEQLYAEKVLIDSGNEQFINESIFLVDCRNDNKKSASKA